MKRLMQKIPLMIFARLLALLIVVSLPEQALAAISAPNVSSQTFGSNNVHSISHNLIAGADRILLINTSTESGDQYLIQSITINGGGNVGTRVNQVQSTAGIGHRVEMWRVMEAQLPASGTITIQVTWNGDVRPGIGVMSFSGVAQQPAEATATQTCANCQTISQSITTLTDAALIVSNVGNGDGDNYPDSDHGSGQIELWDQQPSSARHAGTYEITTSAGADIQSHRADSSVNRQAQVIAAFASSSATPPSINTPLAYYASDETIWSGSAGEVIDQSTNAFHAQAMNGAITENSDPALVGNPGTCGYGEYDGNNDYIALPNTFPDLQGSFTITAWIQADSGDRDRRIFADDENNSGGYALSLGDAGPGQLRFFSRGVNPVSLDTGREILPNRWYFVSAVHDASTKTREIFVDGVSVASGTYTGNWGTDNGIASIGGETNNAGSENSNNFRFDGNIDEVRIYSYALSGTDITEVMNLRHPCGTTPALTCGPVPSTYPVFSSGDDLDVDDDVTIDVGSGPVSVQDGDNNGNAIDVSGTVGDVISATQTLPTIEPATFPVTGSVDINIPDNNTRTIDVADNPPGDGTYDDIRVRDNATANFTGGGPFYIDRLRADDNATINFSAGTYFIDRLEVRGDDVTINVSGAVRLFIGNRFNNNGDNLVVNQGGSVANLVVFLYPNAEFDMDGEELDFTGVIYGPDSGKIKIKDNSKITGAIIGGDEIELDDDVQLIYTPSVAAAVASITTCSNTFSHFVVIHDGFGINCAPETIRIDAIGTDGNAYDAGGIGVVLDTQSGSGSWASIASNTGLFADTTPNDGLATYTFASGEISASFSLDYSQGSSNTLNIAVRDPVTNAILDSDLEGDLVYSPSGFTITNSPLANPFDGNIPVFPPQVAGTDVPIYITAYGQTDTDPVCGVIEAYDGPKPLQFWFDYINPGRDSGINPSINTVAIPDNTEANALTQPALGLLTFTAGRTSVTTKYKDVGRINLGVKDTTAHPNLPNGIRGQLGIIFRPADILIDAVTRANGTGDYLNVAGDLTAPVLAGAGNPFAVRVRVVDAEGDVTPNYGYEDALLPGGGPEGIRLQSASLVEPVGGFNATTNDGLIGNATGLTRTDVDGTTLLADGYFAGINFSFDEVGIISLQADIADDDYLGAGNTTGTASTNVGRFIPDRFTVTDNVPDFADACTTFSYMDQAFGFNVDPILTVNALNEAGTPTRNYDFNGVTNFWRLNSTLATRSYTDTATSGPAVFTPDITGSTVTVGDTTNGDGDGTLTISNEQFTYLRPADPFDLAGGGADPAIPFNAQADLVLPAAELTDDDGACLDADNDGTCEAYTLNIINGPEQRFGRITTANAFGSELLPLQLPVSVQYFQDSTNGFVTSTDDTCTTLTDVPAGPPIWGDISLPTASYSGNLDEGETSPAAVNFIGGLATIILSAPGSTAGIPNTGSVLVNISIDDWLKFNWDGVDQGADANLNDDDPSATASFGIFHGNDATIYRRELY